MASANIAFLHQIQKDCGITNKDLKEAVETVARPREVELPVFHERLSKKEKKVFGQTKKQKKREKYKLVYWYLEEYLKPKYREETYCRFEDDFKGLIEYCYDQVLKLIELSTVVIERDVDPEELLPELDFDPETDIPDTEWKNFKEYCKEHPIERASDIFKRRDKFKKHLRKKRKRLYSKKRLLMYDPLFAMDQVNAKAMKKNLERISRENEQRIQAFNKLLDRLVGDEAISSSAMANFKKHTKAMMARHKDRLDKFIKDAGLEAAVIGYDVDDAPRVYRRA